MEKAGKNQERFGGRVILLSEASQLTVSVPAKPSAVVNLIRYGEKVGTSVPHTLSLLRLARSSVLLVCARPGKQARQPPRFWR